MKEGLPECTALLVLCRIGHHDGSLGSPEEGSGKAEDGAGEDEEPPGAVDLVCPKCYSHQSGLLCRGGKVGPTSNVERVACRAETESEAGTENVLFVSYDHAANVKALGVSGLTTTTYIDGARDKAAQGKGSVLCISTDRPPECEGDLTHQTSIGGR